MQSQQNLFRPCSNLLLLHDCIMKKDKVGYEKKTIVIVNAFEKSYKIDDL